MAASTLRPLFVFLYILGSFFVSTVFSETSQSTYWQVPMQVVEYTSYRNVKVLEFSIPEFCVQSSWLFTALKSDNDCPNRHVDIYIQHGSYPVVNPLNETYPEKFNLHRTELQYIAIPPNNTSRILKMQNPIPGSWYAITFINDYTDDKLTVQGLNDDNCAYFLGSTHVVDTLESVIDLVTDVPIPIKTRLGYPNKHRFFISEETWQYTVSVQNCQFINITEDSNSTSSNVTGNSTETEPIPPCPLIFSVRSQGLADVDGSGFVKDCSKLPNDTNCEFTMKSPTAGDWQYLTTNPLRSDGKVTFILKITTKECVPYHSQEYPMDDLEPTNENMTDITEANSTQKMQNSSDNEIDNPAVQKMPHTSRLVSSVYQSNTQEVAEDGVYVIPRKTLEDNINDDVVVVSKRSLDDRSLIPDAAQEEAKNSTDPEGFNATTFDHCLTVPELGRYVPSGRAFHVHYALRIGSIPFPDRILVRAALPIVMKFVIKQNIDIGGTLRFGMGILKESLNISDQNVGVTVCIQQGGIPLDDDGPYCRDDNKLVLNTTDQDTDYVYFPYPEAGNWYIAMQAYCYDNSGQVEKCKDIGIGAEFSINLQPCVDGECTSNGECREYFSGVFHFSSCYCIADYRGYGCTDDSVAKTHGDQLEEALLLTMSNLLFIPAIIIATYRRFYVEALVYFYTMFMSTFYHACDGDRTLIYCMMPYGVLSYTDFYGSILSFWVTLVSMARLPSEQAKSFLFMLAALSIALGVQWNKHNLWVQLVPILGSLCIMGVSWLIRCFRRKVCYPTKQRWLFLIVPGTLIAGLGLIIFTFFETDSNYKYTHSAWHACMAIAIVFLLPPRKTDRTGFAAKEHVKPGPRTINNSSTETNQNGFLPSTNRNEYVNTGLYDSLRVSQNKSDLPAQNGFVPKADCAYDNVIVDVEFENCNSKL